MDDTEKRGQSRRRAAKRKRLILVAAVVVYFQVYKRHINRALEATFFIPLAIEYAAIT